MKKSRIAAALMACVALLAGALPARAGQGSAAQAPAMHRAPFLGADVTYADWPHPVIEGWRDAALGEPMAEAFRAAGVRSLRFAFAGIYSPRGAEASAALRAANKLTNQFPWFPFEAFLDFLAAHEFTAVVGVNVEEDPEVAASVVEAFRKRDLLGRLVAIELSNEPHLSPRPWLPEEYAERAAAIIERLTPMGVKFALPLTVGRERNTPTRLSDDQYNRRMLAELSKQIDLKNRDDIYGVLHLYARGMRAPTVDYFNREVRPFAPRMRYLVTEFNIRLGLEGNPHLTDKYAMEFARRVAEVMARPEIEGMYVHSVPYHAIVYWSNGGQTVTVVGHRDARLSRADRSRGWHLTPAGRVYGLYSKLAYNGDLLAFSGGKQSAWAVRDAAGRVVLTLLNDSGKAAKKKIRVAGREWTLEAPARSIVCYDEQMVELARLTLGAA